MRFGKTYLFLFVIGHFYAFGPVLSKIRLSGKDSTLNFVNSSSHFVVNEAITDFGGTLKVVDDAVGRVIGENITFNGGAVDVGGSKFCLTGVFDPQANNEISLANGQRFELSSGTVDKPISIASGATVSIFGSPNFSQAITLGDSASVLNLGIQSKLSQDINLNGGKVVLTDDLSVIKDKQFLGGGTIDINGRTLWLPGGSVADSDITFLNANDIPLTANINLGFDATFSGVGGTTEITGNGYIINFLTNGGFSVNPSHTVFVTSISLTNFGAGATTGFFDIDATSTIVLQDCTIELAGNYAHDQGTIIFAGRESRIITNGFTFDTSGSLVFLNVDNTTVEYDNQDGVDQRGFTFTDEFEQNKSTGNGTIRSATARASLNLAATSQAMFRDYFLADDSVINVTNATPASPKAVTIDFDGHSVHFPTAGSSLLNLDPNVNLTLENTILVGFNKDVVSYGDANATLEFGTGTQIQLFDDVTIGGGDKDWDFTADGSIFGPGVILTLDGANKLTVTSSSTLTLKGLRIVCKNVDSLACLDQTSKIVFENCSLVLEAAGLEFTAGSIDVDGALDVFGGSPAAVDTESKLSFSGQGLFRVLSESKMTVYKGVEFEYKADPTGDGSDTSATKRHFLLVDPTSVLQLDGATLHSTTTAFALDHGRLIIDDKVNFVIDGVDAESSEIGSALDLLVRPGGTFEVDGVVKYISTTFP